MKYTTSIYHLCRPIDENHAIALARAGYNDGADGTCFELASFPPELRTVDVFRRIVNAVPLPSIFCVYRNDAFLGGDDEARMEGLLKAADAGADFIDVMADLFDPSPDQISHSPDAVARQRAAIDEVHARGAKVIVSSHIPDHPLSADQVLRHLKAEADRGADVCKLVAAMPTAADYSQGVEALAQLRSSFDRPYIFLGSDTFGRLLRFTGPSFGCGVEFAVHDFDPSATYDQPTIRALRQSMDSVLWQAPGADFSLADLARPRM